jgi:aminoglycoside phosphotransferase (APT) family kinase protein
VLGAHFLVMQYRPGLVIGAELPPGLDSRAVGGKLGLTLVRTVAALHAVDPGSVGLGELGKPQGFLERTTEGWAKRAMLATTASPRPILDELVEWLRANRVPEREPVLLHSDFKLDNVVLDPQTLEPVAMLDWDMSTRGDPMFDLATLLSYWSEPGDPQAMHDLRQMPTALPGFPTRREILAMYAELSGRDVSDFQFHRVLGMFKLAVVFLQLHARYRSGGTQDERFASFEQLGHGLLEFTHEIAHGRAF